MIGVEVVGTQLNIAVEHFDSLGVRIKKSIAATALEIVRELRQFVILGYLSGEVLKKVSGKLISAIRTVVFAAKDELVARLYLRLDIAPYGAVHEKGGTFSIPTHVRHLRSGKETTVRQHTRTYPRRSFMERAMLAKSEEIRLKLLGAIEAAI